MGELPVVSIAIETIIKKLAEEAAKKIIKYCENKLSNRKIKNSVDIKSAFKDYIIYI